MSTVKELTEQSNEWKHLTLSPIKEVHLQRQQIKEQLTDINQLLKSKMPLIMSAPSIKQMAGPTILSVVPQIKDLMPPNLNTMIKSFKNNYSIDFLKQQCFQKNLFHQAVDKLEIHGIKHLVKNLQDIQPLTSLLENLSLEEQDFLVKKVETNPELIIANAEIINKMPSIDKNQYLKFSKISIPLLCETLSGTLSFLEQCPEDMKSTIYYISFSILMIIYFLSAFTFYEIAKNSDE